MYSIKFSDKALKQLKVLDKKVQKRILNSISRIQVNPERHVKKLTDSSYFRFRIGEHRLILDINRKKLIITVVILGHRKKIYKWL